MLAFLSHESIFLRFLTALKVPALVKETYNGYRTIDHSRDFQLIKKTNTIVFRQQNVVLDGPGYKKNEELFIYKIKEDLGNIVIEDQNKHKVLVLTDSHAVLRIEDTTPHRTTKLTANDFIKASGVSEGVVVPQRTQLQLF